MMANVDSVLVESGLDLEREEFTWTISDFADVVQNHTFYSKRCEFQAGRGEDFSSKWLIYMIDDEEFMQISYQLESWSIPAFEPKKYPSAVMIDLSFGIEGADGEMLLPSRSTGRINMLVCNWSSLNNFFRMRDIPALLVDGSLIVRVALKVYLGKPLPPPWTLSVRNVGDFTWQIKSFPIVMREYQRGVFLLDTQELDFWAEDSTGICSKWRVSLKNTRTGNREHWDHIGIWFKLVERTKRAQDMAYAKCNISVESGDGNGGQVLAIEKKFGPCDMLAKGEESGIGHPFFLRKSTVAGLLIDEALVIRIKFAIYPSPVPE